MDAPWIAIRDLAPHEGSRVLIKGWMYNKRSSGKICFLQLRDGSGFIQAVVEKASVPEKDFEIAKSLLMEASLEVEGTVRADPRAPSGYELSAHRVRLVHNPAEEYPIAKKEHGVDFLMDLRHLWIRSRRQHAILSVRGRIMAACEEFLRKEGFLRVDGPILTGSVGEGASGLFELDYFDMGKAYLAQTGQLYAEAAAAAFGKVYTFGPTFRAEKSKTRRHLTEFWMLEPEVAFYEHADNLVLQENLVSHVIRTVLADCRSDLAILERDVSKLERIEPPFYRITYDEAVEILGRLGSDIPYGDDLGGDDETLLTQQYDRPVFVQHYPKNVKAFYMKQHPEREDLVLCDDCLAPEGYGEIIGGSQREDDLDLLLARIRGEGLPEESYAWYLDLRRYGSFPHSGFGMGIERVVAWACGLSHIREAIPWPRTIYRLNP
jgi:asparaginyl-tRNA synthetase